MAVRILLVLLVLTIFYGCARSSNAPEQDEKQGDAEPEVATHSATAHQETTQQETDAANTNSVGGCADNGNTAGQQEAARDEVSNGKIAFSRATEDVAANSDIYVIDEDGAHETRLTHTAHSEAFPIWSPDGKKIAFVSSEQSLRVMNADGTNQTTLAEDVSPEKITWSPDAKKIAFTGSGDLYVINADGTTIEARLPTPIPENPWDDADVGNPAWSPTDEKIAFVTSTVPGSSTGGSSNEPASVPAETMIGIYLINPNGTGLCKLTSITHDASSRTSVLSSLVWSPDGQRIAFIDTPRLELYVSDIYVINIDGSGRKQIRGSDARGSYADAVNAWSPDGRRIAFTKAPSDIYVINADGSERRRLTITPGPLSGANPTWSPDGEKIAFSCFEGSADARIDLCVVKADGTGFKRIAKGGQGPASWGRR